MPEFNAGDIAWVRSLKSSKFGILNCQCRTVVIASRIRSTFASLVKSTPIPAFIGKVLLWVLDWHFSVIFHVNIDDAI